MPACVADAKQIQYQGCYGDRVTSSTDPSLPFCVTTDDKLTPHKCIEHCRYCPYDYASIKVLQVNVSWILHFKIKISSLYQDSADTLAPHAS